MYILHIETSTAFGSIALSNRDRLMGAIHLTEGMQHTAMLTPAIEKILKQERIEARELVAISVSTGPGSYTGLRVGNSTAKALAYSLRIPLLSVPTLKSMAWAVFQRHHEAEIAWPMIDARRNEVYTAIYDRELNEILPVSALITERNNMTGKVPAGRPTVICGDGASKVNPEHLEKEISVDLSIRPHATHLIGPAFQSFEAGQFSDVMHHVPMYLKPPNITQPRPVKE